MLPKQKDPSVPPAHVQPVLIAQVAMIPKTSIYYPGFSAFTGLTGECMCPSGEYVNELYAYKYSASISSLACKCSGGKLVGDETIIKLVTSDSTSIQTIVSTVGFRLLYFYLLPIYSSGLYYVGGISVTRISLEQVPPPDQLRPIPNLIGSVYKHPTEQVVTSSVPITGFVYDMGTDDINAGIPCACDICYVTDACTNPDEAAMYCRASPNISGVRVYV